MQLYTQIVVTEINSKILNTHYANDIRKSQMYTAESLVSTNFIKTPQNENLWKLNSAILEILQTDGRSERHGEANRRVFQIFIANAQNQLNT
jgi:hypothetical protein